MNPIMINESSERMQNRIRSNAVCCESTYRNWTSEYRTSWLGINCFYYATVLIQDSLNEFGIGVVTGFLSFVAREYNALQYLIGICISI